MVCDTSIKVVEDIRQSSAYGKYLSKIGWEVINLKKAQVQVFLRQLGPVSLVKIQRTETVPNNLELKELFIKRKVFMCKIEPSEGVLSDGLKSLIQTGFKISNSPLLGTKTSRVNLKPAEQEIFSGFRKDCRYCIRKIDDGQYQQIKSGELEKFYEIWKKSAKRKNLWIPSKKDYLSLISAFGNNALAITVRDVAGAVVLINKQTAFYYYAGSTAEGVRENLPYLVVWTAMKEAKKRGCTVWDFEGVYDQRWPNKSWAGFSHFKKSFGGKEVEYPGSFEKWRWPF